MWKYENWQETPAQLSRVCSHIQTHTYTNMFASFLFLLTGHLPIQHTQIQTRWIQSIMYYSISVSPGEKLQYKLVFTFDYNIIEARWFNCQATAGIFFSVQVVLGTEYEVAKIKVFFLKRLAWVLEVATGLSLCHPSHFISLSPHLVKLSSCSIAVSMCFNANQAPSGSILI